MGKAFLRRRGGGRRRRGIAEHRTEFTPGGGARAEAIGGREETALGYREPPNYIRPVGETEGAAMLAARKWSDAKAAFERALVERPHSGFALYGMAYASEQAGDREAAVKAYGEFLEA